MTRSAARRRVHRPAAGLPPPLLPLALLALVFLVLPVVGLLVRTPWRTL